MFFVSSFVEELEIQCRMIIKPHKMPFSGHGIGLENENAVC